MRLVESIAGMALCLLIGFAGGCVHEKLGARDDLAAVRAQLGVANGNVDACAASLDDLRQQQAQELAKADQHAAATKQALEDVVRENLALADQLSDVERQMAMARQEPTCSEQLEVELCAAVPLL